MAYLVLVRHGQSEWNEKGLWTGKTDISLTNLGKKQARDAGKAIKNIHFDICFTSQLKRAKETLSEIVTVLNIFSLPIHESASLAEKDYGDFTGKNKWDVKKELGEEAFIKIRRSWDYKIPNGESLQDVYNRVVAYYKKAILPELLEGKNVIIVAHGNSIRALAKYLERITDEDIPSYEIKVGEVLVYEIDPYGDVAHKEKRVKTETIA